MNTQQTARHDMFYSVLAEGDNKPEVVALIPEFKKGFDRLRIIATTLQRLRVEQERDITGVSSNKGDTFDNLEGYFLEVSGGVFSYAASIKDTVLMARVNYTSGMLGEMNQAMILAAAAIVLAEAKKIPAEKLIPFGISAEDMTELERLIDLFTEVKPTPRSAIVERATITEEIRVLFTEATALFRDTLDRLAIQFKRKNPEFYQNYRRARNVIYRSASNPETPAQ